AGRRSIGAADGSALAARRPAARGDAVMNEQFRPTKGVPAGMAPAEWQARLDLAAAYRLIAHYGWGDVIYNHSSTRVPGEERKFSQPAVRFYQRVGYHDYEGITEDFDERARINRDLGRNRALILRNHGLLTVGRSVREAFVLMKYLIEAAHIQLMMESTGGELIEIPPAVCAKTAAQYEHHDSGRGSADWPAYLRMVDQVSPGYDA